MATAAAASAGGLCSGSASLSVRPRRVLTRPAAAFRTLSCNEHGRNGHLCGPRGARRAWLQAAQGVDVQLHMAELDTPKYTIPPANCKRLAA